MPATIGELLQGKPDPVTTRPHESLTDALARMVRHDYSQLPVVDDDGKPVAIITADSIVRALHNFDVLPGALRVLDAMRPRFSTCEIDDEVLDYLDDLQEQPAIFVADPRTKKLVGILTSHDTTDYFRRRAQDIMLVQDIEEMIKNYVRAAFNGADEGALSSAIDEITPSNTKELQPRFNKALARYLELSGGTNTKIDYSLAKKAFEEHLYQKEDARAFERLTLNDYIELLVSKTRWERYERVLRLDREALRRLLASVRNTRNDLAHFRTDISEEQREKLRFCKDWLEWHEEGIEAAFAPAPKPGETPPQEARATHPPPPSVPADVPLPDELNSPEESRYEKLSKWLEKQPADRASVGATFDEIEAIIESKLPASARDHRSWWGNNPKGHTQSKQWLDAGWRVAGVSFRTNTVIFSRNDDRGKAYVAFFSRLQDMVRNAKPEFPVKTLPPGGYHWTTVGQLPDLAHRVAFLNFSFTRRREFRVELYIDATDRERNKRIFDALHRNKNVIEAELGETLHWERIDDKRASRIAVYRQGSITDDESQLAQLREAACELMLRFGRVMREHLAAVERESAGMNSEHAPESSGVAS